MKESLEKLKFKIDIKTLFIIATTIGSISYRGASILNQIENMEVSLGDQKAIIKQIAENDAKNDDEHSRKLAWLEPTVLMILKKMGL